jgi:hypothetical protein
MNGSAPYSPVTGSQTSVRQKFNPNFWIESMDCRVSSNPIAATMSTSTSAKAPVPSRNTTSAPPFLDIQAILPIHSPPL